MKTQSENFLLEKYESMNSLSMVELLIKEPISEVLSALLELATSAQNKLASDSGNSELQSYACSLAWHYHRLKIGANFAEIIKKAKTENEELIKLNIKIDDLNEKFKSLETDFLILEDFLISRKRLRPFPERFDRLNNDLLLQAILLPSESKRLMDSKVIDYDEWLDGMLALCRSAPWIEKYRLPTHDYYVDPLRRLDLLNACDDLIDRVNEWKRDKIEILSQFEVKEKRLSDLQKVAEKEWFDLRCDKFISPWLVDHAQELILERRAAKIK